jgi:mono/diheme cytochrome c family protein
VTPFLTVVPPVGAADMTPAERGKKAMLERSFNPPTISVQAYRNAWQQWGGLKEAPADYNRAFMERYGLHPAPYPNNGYPMGLREARGLFGKALSQDCMLCHGGSILGQSYVGLGNASFDYQSLFEDLAAADGRSRKTPFTFCNVRGTIEAGGFSVFLLSFREPDLQFRPKPLEFNLRDDLCEDTPAWWLYRKKKTIYYTGAGDARSVRTLMQFMMSPLNPPAVFQREEATFRDVQAYLRSIEPPPYPLPIDHTLARRGEELFLKNCARCHGTYGKDWTYPNKIVPLAEIGTDPARFRGLSEAFGRYYNRSWFAREEEGWFVDDYPGKFSAGYQAPPLDGIWATAPYFHNGAVPTVYHVLNSKARPRVFTRSYRTNLDDYDPVQLGWKIRVLDRAADRNLPPFEQRFIYDTTQPGRGNGGHTYGDKLTDEERRAVIEYLKTL